MNSHPFSPGDRVVAVNTQEGPLRLLIPIDSRRFDLPDGPVHQGVVYHVSAVTRIKDGSPGVFITGLRCLWGNRNFPWAACRFRKVESVGHPRTATVAQKTENEHCNTVPISRIYPNQKP